MKQSHRTKRPLALLLALCTLLLCGAPCLLQASAATAAPTAAYTESIDLSQYLVLDLAKGNITIQSSGYSGWAYLPDAGGTAYTLTQVTNGTWTAETKFYVFQSSTKQGTVPTTVNGNLLTLNGIDMDNAFMINNKDVTDVMETWAATANGNRTATSHYITLTTTGKAVDLTIDDVWSSTQNHSSSYTGKNGGLNINVATSGAMKVDLKLKGDNRFAYLYYYSGTNSSGSLTVKDGSTNGKTGSLTVIGGTTLSSSYSGATNYNNSVSANNWNSVIGGTDSSAECYNLTFEGGVIYAGAHDTENCTAIGAGGNGFGEVTVKGGTVTAVSHSTGTAIGGGIAHTGTGGKGQVTVTGGEVYAYNFGINAYDRVSSGSYGSNSTEIKTAARHIPGTAIGGASSIQQAGASGTVTISGGKVYAESLGGSAIGGGNSIVGAGGIATVDITGGEIEAISSHSSLTFKDGTTLSVPAGTAIGGGSSKLKAGGTATVNITGGRTLATGIGGGGSMKSTGGDATVTMEGGTVVSTGIGGGFSEANGFAQGAVTVTGGSLNSSMSAIPRDGNGATLYLTRISYFLDAETMANEKVENILFRDTTAYGQSDIYTDSVGMIYLWLPEGAAVISSKLMSGAPNYTPNDEADADIDANGVGSLLYDTTLPRYIVNIAGSGYYSLYFDEAITSNFSGAVIHPQGNFTYYLQVTEGYSLTPYIGITDTDGNKVLTPGGELTHVTENVYSSTLRIDSDTKVWYHITEIATGTGYFALDLTNGNITLTENGGELTIEQAGYKLAGYKGAIHLTSSGFPTSNTMTFRSESDTPSRVQIVADELNLIASNAAFTVESGNLAMIFDDHDNMIHSAGGAPIYVAENARLHLDTTGVQSLKISSSKGASAIVGPGTFSLDNQGGFLTMTAPAGVAQISVGTYEFSGGNKQFTTELYKGSYSYTLVGFVQNSVLYPANVKPSSTNTQSFSARGIYEVYQGVSSSWTVANEKLNLTLTTLDAAKVLGSIKIVRSDGTDITDAVLAQAVATADYTTSSTVSLAIDGTHFKDGNLTVYAAAHGLIPYEIISYNGVYDGQPHGITVVVDEDLFAVTYSAGGVTGTVNPQQTDVVSNYVVTVYITAKDANTAYNDVTAQGSITITKGTNVWTHLITCPDLILGGGAPKASATPKWGTVTYTYYDADKQPLSDVSALGEGLYYVQATVPATANYDEILSDMIRFEVLEAANYAAWGRILDRIDIDADNATSRQLSIRSTGAFSVYFETISLGNDALTFTVPLPANVKITMLVIDEGGAITYYYRMPDAATTTLPLNGFSAMGGGGTYSATAGTAVRYQFCFEYTALSINQPFDIQLNATSAQPLSQSIGTPSAYAVGFDAVTGDEKISTAVQNDALTVCVKPNISTPENKLLAFRILPATGVLSGFSATLQRAGSTADAITLTYAGAGLLVYHIGDSATASINDEYTLTLHHLPAGTYTVTSYIRSTDSGDLATAYLPTAFDGECSIGTTVTFTPNAAPALYATADKRLVAAGDTLTFELTSNVAFSDTVSVVLMQKNASGAYVPITNVMSVALTAKSGNTATTAGITIPTDAPAGTYRLQFIHGDAVYCYNVILQ